VGGMRTVIVATNPRGCRARSCTLSVATGRYVKSAPHCGYDTSSNVVTAPRHRHRGTGTRGSEAHGSFVVSARCNAQLSLHLRPRKRPLTISRPVVAQDAIRQHLIQRGGGAKVRQRGQQIWRVNAADHVRQRGAAGPVRTACKMHKRLTARLIARAR
jgi:hypothetical protein